MSGADDSGGRRGSGTRVRRRIAATASAAAIAVGGGVAAAASPAAQPRAAKKAATRIAGSERSGEQALAALARGEREQQRLRLAGALAPQLPRDAARIADALGATEELLANAYAGGAGEDPRVNPGAELARRIGVEEADVDAAFERMAREARARRAREPGPG